MKFVNARLERSNVLLCRAIARIGEVFSKKTEGFGKNQRYNMSALPVSQKSRFAAVGSTPSARRLATSPVTTDVATQRKTLQCFRLLIVMHSCIAHGMACLYRRRRGDTVGDNAAFSISRL